jgi:hypothetical protein
MDENVTFYLRNKDLLEEIHKSKNSYSEFDTPEDGEYDLIIYPDSFELPFSYKHTLDALYEQCLLSDNILLAKTNKANKINSLNKEIKDIKLRPKKISADDIPTDGLIFRILSYEHIPNDVENRKKTPKTIQDTKHKLNFVPFIHVKLINGKLTVVGRSHFKNGQFCVNKGNITNTLADMFMLLVEKYSQRPNWRGYTYVNEMKGQALLHLVYMGLKFNEHKSDNPFTYYTQTISNSFTRVFNEEKEHQDIRDDLLEEYGHNPSMTRQLQNEESQRKYDI